MGAMLDKLTPYQRARQRKILKEVSEILHKSRLKQASWLERMILKHIERKRRLKH